MSNNLSTEKKIHVLSLLVEGNSIRSIERITDIHRDTITKLLVKIGDKCRKIVDEYLKNIDCKEIQVDELWTFVRKKQKNLTREEKQNQELGDQYIFVAIDAETKLVPCFTIGKRTMNTALQFIYELKERLNGIKPQLTTDGYRAYEDAVERVFGCNIDYAQLIKVYEGENTNDHKYSPPKIKKVSKKRISGKPKKERISTSYVERNNLTMRMQVGRLKRLTIAFSKKLENLTAALYLHFAYYNFVRIHKTLSVTPAMEAGITDRIWEIKDLLK